MIRKIFRKEYRLYILDDVENDFFAAICLHHGEYASAIGGCRYLDYKSSEDALADVVALSSAMKLKAFHAGLPYNGGKAVIKQSRFVRDREMMLAKFAVLVNHLKGKYIATVDSGITVDDLSILKYYTPFVIGEGDPRIATATASTVFNAMCALLKRQDESIENLRVAIQGVGSVGFLLAQKLSSLGCELIISDTNQHRLHEVSKVLNAKVVSPKQIFSVKCDIFSPCALGGVIDEKTLSRLRCRYIVGAANNQLAHQSIRSALIKRKIDYVDDYIANAGGLIYLSNLHQEKINRVRKECQDPSGLHRERPCRGEVSLG